MNKNGLIFFEGVWVKPDKAKTGEGNPSRARTSTRKTKSKRSIARGALLDMPEWMLSVTKKVAEGMRHVGMTRVVAQQPPGEKWDLYHVESDQGVLSIRVKVSQDKRWGAHFVFSCKFEPFQGKKKRTGTIKQRIFVGGKLSAAEVASEICRKCGFC